MLPENEDDPLLEQEQSNRPTAGYQVTQILETDIYRKFIYAVIWASFTGYITGVTSAIADNRSISLYDDSTQYLGDIGIDFVHLFINGEGIDPRSDAYCVYILLFIFFIFIICLKAFKLKTTYQIIDILIEFGVIFNVMFTLRYLNVCLTSFPTPSKQILWEECGEWNNVWIAPFLMFGAHRSACHDFFFSGHTIVVTVCALVIAKYSIVISGCNSWWIFNNIHWRILRATLVGVVWVIVALTILFLLVLELHYTIDITAAFMLIIVIWKYSQAQRKYEYGFFGWWHVVNDKVHNDLWNSVYSSV